MLESAILPGIGLRRIPGNRSFRVYLILDSIAICLMFMGVIAAGGTDTGAKIPPELVGQMVAGLGLLLFALVWLVSAIHTSSAAISYNDRFDNIRRRNH